MYKVIQVHALSVYHKNFFYDLIVTAICK